MSAPGYERTLPQQPAHELRMLQFRWKPESGSNRVLADPMREGPLRGKEPQGTVRVRRSNTGHFSLGSLESWRSTRCRKLVRSYRSNRLPSKPWNQPWNQRSRNFPGALHITAGTDRIRIISAAANRATYENNSARDENDGSASDGDLLSGFDRTRHAPGGPGRIAPARIRNRRGGP